MGYTQYWRRPATISDDAMRAIVDDFGLLILPLDDAGVKLCGGDGKGAALVTPDGVSFSGSSNRTNEPFNFPRIMQPEPWKKPVEGLYSAFCKTGLAPYDLAVMAFLLVAKHHVPEIQIATDGGDEQWSKARQFCQDILGYGREYRINSGKQLEIVHSE